MMKIPKVTIALLNRDNQALGIPAVHVPVMEVGHVFDLLLPEGLGQFKARVIEYKIVGCESVLVVEFETESSEERNAAENSWYWLQLRCWPTYGKHPVCGFVYGGVADYDAKIFL